MLSAIIVAGGSSRRVGFDKLFAPVAGQPLIAHTIRAFVEAKCVEQIVIVARDEIQEQLRALVPQAKFTRGGEHRQDSVRAGMDAVSRDADYIGVHDAARPLITPGEIARVYETARKHGAAVLAAPVSDTLKRANDGDVVVESIDRARLFAMQTPQIFARELLERAYAEVARRGANVTDEVSAMQLIDQRVRIVEARELNMKVTFARDLALADAILTSRARSD